MGMKMAMASQADLEMTVTLANALEALSRYLCLPAEMSEDPEEQSDEFDSDNADQCMQVLQYLLDLNERGSLHRVVGGLWTLLAPSNKVVNPDLDYLDHHPDTIAAKADSARLRWLTEDHQDPAVRAKCRELIERMPVMSYSAFCSDIDLAMPPAKTADGPEASAP